MSRRATVLSSTLLFLSVVGCGDDDGNEPNEVADTGTPTGSQRSDAATVETERDAGQGDTLDASDLDAAQTGDGGLSADASAVNASSGDAGHGDASSADASSADASVADATVSTMDATAPGEDASVALVPLSATLINFVTDAPISASQQVSFLNNQTGEPLSPPIEIASEATTGKITAQVPPGAHIVWVKGTGDLVSGTFDTALLNVSEANWTDTYGVFPNSIATVADLSGQYEARADRAGLTGAVYWTQNGKRAGTVGCAKLYLDGATAPDLDQSQRYNAAGTALPLPLALQDQTARTGVFSFGNITKGTHTLRVSIDDGQTFLGAPVTFYVPITNDEASSDLKRVAAQLAVDVEATENPTPADCTVN